MKKKCANSSIVLMVFSVDHHARIPPLPGVARFGFTYSQVCRLFCIVHGRITLLNAKVLKAITTLMRFLKLLIKQQKMKNVFGKLKNRYVPTNVLCIIVVYVRFISIAVVWSTVLFIRLSIFPNPAI